VNRKLLNTYEVPKSITNKINYHNILLENDKVQRREKMENRNYRRCRCNNPNQLGETAGENANRNCRRDNILAGTLADTYNQGYREGYNDGYNDGFTGGRDQGNMEGYRQGVKDANAKTRQAVLNLACRRKRSRRCCF
jgi:flagellar biosynthesis/type III secretory pathway protein FliH